MRRLGLVVGSLVAPALACSLAVSTDGLAGPPLEPDPDASSSAESGILDGSPDRETGEGGQPDGGSFCPRHPTATFCADFDDTTISNFGFTDEATSGDNSTTVSSDAVSAPNALSAHVGRSTSGQTSARPYRDLPFIARTMHVELDAKLCDVSSGLLEFLKIETSSAGLHAVLPGFESADVALTVTPGESSVAIEYYNADGSGGGGGSLLPQMLPTGTWFHLALDVVFSAGESGMVALFIDRATTPALAQSGIRTLSASPSAMRVLVGAYTNATASGCTTLIDNLLVEATP